MSLIDRRIRGFRLIDIVAMALLVAIVLGVYLAKTVAGRERAEIAKVEHQIESERKRIRLLHAEVAYLEQPARIERLSSEYLGLAPITAKNETTLEDLDKLAQKERMR
jgi:cell division protein FtsL